MAQGLPETNGDPTNDTIAGAETAACNAQHYGSLSTGTDNDVWCFTLGSLNHVVVWTSERGAAATTDTIVDIFDSNGATVASNDDEPGAPGFMSLVSTDIGPGTFYVNVRGFGTSNPGDYAFDLLCGPAGGGIVVGPAEVEPNDSCATGTLANVGEAQDNDIDAAGDVDYYCFSLPSATTVDIETSASTATSGTAAGDTQLNLYDSACGFLAFDDDGGAGFYSLLAGQALAAGTYYAAVNHFSGSGTGDYRLVITDLGGGGPIQSSTTITELQPPPSSLCGGGFNSTSEAEPNDDCATGNAAACCDSIEGTITTGEDDFFCLTLASELVMTFETHASTATTGTEAGDTQLRLYDSNCTQIDFNDDGGAGFYSLLSAQLPAGTWYVGVRHFSGTGTGDYRLDIDCTPLQAACNGTSGNPITFAPRLGERPRIGTQWTTDLNDAPAGTVVFLATTQIPAIELSIVGMTDCYLGVSPVIVTLPTAPTANPGEAEFGMPYGFFPGASFSFQAAAIDIGATALGVITSDQVITTVVGDESL